ncbi:WD40 repeat-like protein [Rhizodiscina lignyota]|uniref:WD40 repeat-like protein n=1 Tax=Rhizodiscina lignyota TaxID=1504668 RepID=A0A9P4IHI4_9PEZI|nr:WD40 repeat-like protein [Rhizodiscina lignyota]
MKLSNHSKVPVYTVSGSSTARPLPEWLARKRKRSLKRDPEFANRVELLQDFEFEEASSCVRVSEDGNWVMSTGTYKPQIHVHNLSQLSLSFARHTESLNETFLLLSSDYSKSLHLQADRFLEFHTPSGRHYSTRIPRYGRDLVYDRRSTEALVPAVGVNEDGNGEVFRLNLELGRFMKGYEVDVGGDDYSTVGGGALQGGVGTGAVNAAAVAEDSHNLLAFGTSLGTVEFWDPRSRSRVGILSPPKAPYGEQSPAEISCLQFHQSGLTLASGSSDGLIHLYDLRSPVPLLKKDQGYGYPIKTITFLDSSTSSARAQSSEPKILSADKRIIKIWDARDGTPWTSVEPAVDINHVEWVCDSGMILTANEGRQQHSFFIPQLGPAPRWCAFLDNLVEEMAEDPGDPSAFGMNSGGEVYDNYKFLTMPQLRQLNLDHLVGTTALLRPYMHGYFVAQRLYEEARLIANPGVWEQQRAKSVREKIEKERESRIRGNKKVKVKVNRKLAERILEREEKRDRWRARKVLENGGDDDDVLEEDGQIDEEVEAAVEEKKGGVLSDPRFTRLFEDADFEVDETSREFRALNPSTKVAVPETRLPKGLTAVEEEQIAKRRHSSDESSSDDDEDGGTAPIRTKYGKTAMRKSGQRQGQPKMVVSSSGGKKVDRMRDKSFGARVAARKDEPQPAGRVREGGVVGEKEITFAPAKKFQSKSGAGRDLSNAGGMKERHRNKDRRSASGNVFRRM